MTVKKAEIKRPVVSIVDDDQSVRESLKMLFESADYDAEVFASAEDFLSDGQLDKLDCLVLDVQLPGISGIELQNQLRAEGNNIPVIFITAHPDEQIRKEAMRAGAIQFFSKPFSGNDLLAAIRTRQ